MRRSASCVAEASAATERVAKRLFPFPPRRRRRRMPQPVSPSRRRQASRRCSGMPLISCLMRMRPISASSNTTTMIGSPSRWAVCSSATAIRKPPSPEKATIGRSGWAKPCAERAGQRIAHRSQPVGGEEFARRIGLPFLHHQQPAGAGIAGGDGVTRQHGAGDLNGALRRQAAARPIEGLVHLGAEVAGRLLTPAGALRRPFGQRRQQRAELAHDLRIGRHQRIEAGIARERQHGQRVGPRLGLQLDGVEARR